MGVLITGCKKDAREAQLKTLPLHCCLQSLLSRRGYGRFVNMQRSNQQKWSRAQHLYILGTGTHPPCLFCLHKCRVHNPSNRSGFANQHAENLIFYYSNNGHPHTPRDTNQCMGFRKYLHHPKQYNSSNK